MPGGDKTGPLGNGSLTGKRLGFCVGNDRLGFDTTPGNFEHGYGRGFRRGFG